MTRLINTSLFVVGAWLLLAACGLRFELWSWQFWFAAFGISLIASGLGVSSRGESEK